MSKTCRLVVLIPISSVATLEGIKALILALSRIITSKGINEFVFLLAANNIDSDGSSTRLSYANIAKDQLRDLADIKVIGIEHVGGNLTDVGAGRYVFGWYAASQLATAVVSNKSYVIEVDSEDHPPASFAVVLDELLSGKDAAMSARFFVKGSQYKGPFLRLCTSLGATFLANVFGKPGLLVPDLASGLEGYDAQLIDAVFKMVPYSDWVTMGKNGTTVLINTELRLYVLWLLSKENKDLAKYVGFPPITYSQKGALQPFPLNVGVKAFLGLFRIFKQRRLFIK